MKRVYFLEDIWVEENDIVIFLRQANIGGFALELSLLIEGLAQSLRIRQNKGLSLTLTLLDCNQVSKATVIHNPGDKTIRFSMGRNQAEYLYMTLLRAYCDQMPVDHVHIEGRRGDDLFELTVAFELFGKPDRYETKRIIGN